MRVDALWAAEMIHVPPILARAYRSALSARGWQPTRGQEHPIGGESDQATREHFCGRFEVNACRQVALLVDPSSLMAEASEELLHALSVGQMHVLDLCCGAGAATLGLLCALAELRRSGSIACTPLNVTVLGADVSRLALDLFALLVHDIAPQLAEVGVELTLSTSVWDATDAVATRDLLAEFWRTADASDAVVVVAQMSGAAGTEKGFEPLKVSFEQVKLSAIGRGTLLWTEPQSDGAKRLLERLDAYWRVLRRSAAEIIAFAGEYDWLNPTDGATNRCRIFGRLVPRRRAHD